MTIKSTRFPWKFACLHQIWYSYYCQNFKFRVYAEVCFFRGGLLGPPLYTTSELKYYFEGYTTTVKAIKVVNFKSKSILIKGSRRYHYRNETINLTQKVKLTAYRLDRMIIINVSVECSKQIILLIACLVSFLGT